MPSAFRAALGLPLNAHEFLTPLLANIEAGLRSVAKAKDLGKLDIDEQGDLHLPALAALPDEPEARRTRDAISNVDWVCATAGSLAASRCRHQFQ